jgi:hypothetical protein
MIQDSDLLRPSLTADVDSPRPIYSVRTAFLSSFFGGPVAGATIALLNSQRLRRLKIDWPIAALALGCSALVQWSIARHWWAWLDRTLGESSDHYVFRLLGLGFSGVIYAIHRPYYRSMSLLGLRSPNGTGVGIAAIVGGIAVQAGFYYLMNARA